MRMTSRSRYLGLASLLLMFIFLSAAHPRAPRPPEPPGAQAAAECSDSPKACKAPVKFLGESKGCACFACEYGRKSQKILCTRSEQDKRAFKLMLPGARRRAY